uniref:(northern house mosquito) hypothetical protein n=2 Tax=Culex pipiens TaxID=7175 RepID=A0A8D8A5J6_CULPI
MYRGQKLGSLSISLRHNFVHVDLGNAKLPEQHPRSLGKVGGLHQRPHVHQPNSRHEAVVQQHQATAAVQHNFHAGVEDPRRALQLTDLQRHRRLHRYELQPVEALEREAGRLSERFHPIFGERKIVDLFGFTLPLLDFRLSDHFRLRNQQRGKGLQNCVIFVEDFIFTAVDQLTFLNRFFQFGGRVVQGKQRNNRFQDTGVVQLLRGRIFWRHSVTKRESNSVVN